MKGNQDEGLHPTLLNRLNGDLVMDSKITVQYPRSITHVGVTVTDLDKAVEWYQAVLGLYTIARYMTL